MKSLDKEQNKIRLQVFLSHNGVCSRRQAMVVIQKGDVSVNGRQIVEPSFKVDPDKDRILVDGQWVKPKQFDYILLNKPKGYMTTRQDRFAKKTIYDLMPAKYDHLSPVGRLDKETEGLLLLTNDGDVAYRLTHPKFDIDKVYFVCIKGNIELQTIKRLERGVYISQQRTAPAKIFHVQKKREETVLFICIHEGKKRQIRIMFAKMKHKVTYLKRIEHGPIKLGNLKTGQWRALTQNEIKKLCAIK